MSIPAAFSVGNRPTEEVFVMKRRPIERERQLGDNRLTLTPTPTDQNAKASGAPCSTNGRVIQDSDARTIAVAVREAMPASWQRLPGWRPSFGCNSIRACLTRTFGRASKRFSATLARSFRSRGTPMAASDPARELMHVADAPRHCGDCAAFALFGRRGQIGTAPGRPRPGVDGLGRPGS